MTEPISVFPDIQKSHMRNMGSYPVILRSSVDSESPNMDEPPTTSSANGATPSFGAWGAYDTRVLEQARRLMANGKPEKALACRDRLRSQAARQYFAEHIARG